MKVVQLLVPLDGLKELLGLSKDDNDQDGFLLGLLRDAVSHVEASAETPIIDRTEIEYIGDSICDPHIIDGKWIRKVGTLTYRDTDGNETTEDMSKRDLFIRPDLQIAELAGPFPSGDRYRLEVTRGFDHKSMEAGRLRWVLSDIVVNRYRGMPVEINIYNNILRGLVN